MRFRAMNFGFAVCLVLALCGSARAANDFSCDPNCVSVWNFETTGAGPTIVAEASTERSATYAAWKAFDGNLATWWSTSSGSAVNSWLSYSYGAGWGQIITTYVLTATSNVDAAPHDWTFEGWDGASWTVLDTQAGQTGWTYQA